MSSFVDSLRAHPANAPGRRWLFVPYDQLSDGIGPLAREPARELGVILVENPDKAARRPYHRQKLALVLANLRHFALEQAARGVAVRHVVSRPGEGYAGAVVRALDDVGAKGARMMEAAERELRVELQPLVERGVIEVIPHEGWLTTRDQFDRAARGGGPPWRMDAFYGLVRRELRILMERGPNGLRPVGGKLSFDAENRKPWRGDPAAPPPPRFPRDAIKDEVLALVRDRYASHPGTLDGDALPATRADAEALWSRARAECLPRFGPFEDAMSHRSSGLFHTRVSPLLNLHRLLPRRVLDDALASEAPLASLEGFVRQILGWREFVYHVHRATDGFRRLPDGAPSIEKNGASPSALGAREPLPPAYWDRPSGLHCLDTVVADVWREGWSHHITRLMVAGNLAQLLESSPRALTDWFWEAYIDAYDWVVEPNVLGMATWAVADLMVTKPYVAGAAYIHRMSDYCARCQFDPARDCPITPLYWRFLNRHQEALADNPRMAVPLAAARKRDAAKKADDERTFVRVRDLLTRGQRLSPLL